MKAEKLSTEIAALERQSSKAKNAVLKKVLTGKINKLKAELDAITTEPEAKEKLKKAKTKISQMTVKEFAAYIKQLAKDPKFAFLKSMTSDEIVRDIKRTAKPVGWRFRGRENVKKPTKKDIKEKNDVYYEGRRNRSDVSRSVRLATGGGVDINDLDMPVIRTQFEDEEYEYAKGGSIGDSGTITDKNSMFVGKMATITGDLGNMYEVMVLDNGNKRTVLVKKNGISIVSDEFANGGNTGEPHRYMSGMMKNGGETKKYYNHKITVTGKFDNVYDVALFRGKGDAFIAFSALDKAKTSDLFYELKENK